MGVLLLSNDTQPGMAMLEHAKDWIADHFVGGGRILYIPYACVDKREYDARAHALTEALEPMGYTVNSAHHFEYPQANFRNFDGIVVGDGNTFSLLHQLQEKGLLKPLKEVVEGGMPYLGIGAGATIAGPTIMTTNSMPVASISSYTALDLIHVQINPHHPLVDPQMNGVVGDSNIAEYHTYHKTQVVGFRDGSALSMDMKSKNLTLLGANSARIFNKHEEPFEMKPGARLERGASPEQPWIPYYG